MKVDIVEKISKLIFGLLLVCLLGMARQTSDVGTMLGQWKSSSSAPKILAAYMPWFGDPRHMDVGYSSHDRDVIRRQIDEATSMGISGFAVDWNGPRHDYTDKSFALIEQAASEKHFQVALLYNESDDAEQSTDDAYSDMDKAYKAYIGPDAPYHDAYLTYNNRPVIFIFPKSGKTDWNLVRQHVSNWVEPPLLIYKDESSQFANALDGFYVWVHPGEKGWQPDGSDWGKGHLEDFYKQMKDKYPQKILVAGAWPGFDDTKAKWGLNRHMDTRCGKTFEETLHMAQEYSGPNPIPFLMIETWNDYEEGTAIERRSLNCRGK